MFKIKIIGKVKITARLMGIWCIGDDEVSPLVVAMLKEEPKETVIPNS